MNIAVKSMPAETVEICIAGDYDNARAQTELELNDDQHAPMTPCGVFCNR